MNCSDRDVEHADDGPDRSAPGGLWTSCTSTSVPRVHSLPNIADIRLLRMRRRRRILLSCIRAPLVGRLVDIAYAGLWPQCEAQVPAAQEPRLVICCTEKHFSRRLRPLLRAFPTAFLTLRGAISGSGMPSSRGRMNPRSSHSFGISVSRDDGGCAGMEMPEPVGCWSGEDRDGHPSCPRPALKHLGATPVGPRPGPWGYRPGTRVQS